MPSSLGKKIKPVLLTAFVLPVLLSAGCASVEWWAVKPSPAPKRELPPIRAAVMRVPVVLDMPEASVLEGQVPEFVRAGIDQGIPGLGYWTKAVSYRFLREPLAWEVSGNTMLTTMRVHYSLFDDEKGMVPKGGRATRGIFHGIGRFTAGGFGTAKKAVVKAQSVLEWNSDWSVEAKLSSLPLKYLEAAGNSMTPREVLGFIGRSQEDYLLKGTRKLGERLRDFSDLKPRAQEIWSLAQEPVLLEKDIWLVIQPEKMGAGNLRVIDGKPRKIETLFEMTAYPKLIFGPKPSVAKKPLPPLGHLKKEASGFHAESNVTIGFKEVDRLLNDPKAKIVGRVLPGSGERQLKIARLRVYGSGGQLVIRAEMEYQPLLNLTDKPSKMTVYMKGTPRYRLKQRVFDFPDLDFDIKTSDFLVQVAEWFSKDEIRTQLKKQAKIPVGRKMDELKKRMSDVLNTPIGPHATLTTRVDSFEVREAFVSDQGIEGHVTLDGDASLNVKWK